MTTEQKLLRMTRELWNEFVSSTASSPFDKDNRDDVNDFRSCINQLNRIIATRALYDVKGQISFQKIESLEPGKPFKPGPKSRRKKVEKPEQHAKPLTGFDAEGKPLLEDTWSKDFGNKKSKGKDEELE